MYLVLSSTFAFQTNLQGRAADHAVPCQNHWQRHHTFFSFQKFHSQIPHLLYFDVFNHNNIEISGGHWWRKKMVGKEKMKIQLGIL